VNIDSIQNGIVLDHIRAGSAMEIYHTLRLDDLDCTVAIIKNVKSRKMGKKDIIKIDEAINLDLEVLGFLDPNITVNVIRHGALAEKRALQLPKRLQGVVRCKNPRCITTEEPNCEHSFYLANPEAVKQGEEPVYRCSYCESAYRAS
jgi:aspartate carbamoyltransferase regulatory subunit